MARTPMWRRYVRFWGSDVRADVDAELDYHVRELTERLVRQGLDPVEARAEAERRFGDYTRVRAACVGIDRGWERQRRRGQLLADLWQDLRIGARTLTKNPGFTIAAVVVLGLGLGAATVMVSVINAVFVRPLPFPEPDRIFNVVVYEGGPSPTIAHPQAAVALTRDHSQAFSALAGIRGTPGVNLASDRGSVFVPSLRVTAGFFRVFGIEPQLGRGFLREDETAPSTVVLSHAVWAGHFERDPSIVGQVVRLGGRPHTVIGVMPAHFRSYEEADAWTPFRPDPNGMDRNYRLIGRLAPGWTAAQAEAELLAMAVSLRDQLPPVLAELPPVTPDGPRPGVQPYRDVLASRSVGMVWLLTAAVGAILLIVCANAAGLQLARAVGRGRELAVRSALGAGRGRLLRQLLTESVLLAAAGGTVGLLAGVWGLRGLVSAQPQLAVWGVAVDAPTLLGSLGVALATGLTFGLLPGLLAARGKPADALHGGPSRGATAVRGTWLRRSLVVAQVALCTVLLAAVAVFLRTFVGLNSSALGFEPANVLTARASLQGPDYGSGVAVSALYRRTLDELARVPGVEAAAVASNVPVERGLNLPVREAPGGRIAGSVDWRYVTGDYLRVLRIPLVAGRAFGEADHRAGAPPVALVNEEYVRRLGAGRTAIGTRLQTTLIDFDDHAREVVGVLGDVRTRGVTASRPTVFVPVEQVPDELLELAHGVFPVSWALRTREDAGGLIPSVERVIREADPLLSITAFRSMDEVVGGAIAAPRFHTVVLGLFAAAALILAAAGLYGLVAYAVAQSRKEIGIRLALGASARQVTARFARQGIALAAAGAVVGAGGAVLVTELLRRVTEAQPLEPWTVAGAVLVLGAVTTAATVVPARRAARVDPMLTLRVD